MYNFPPNAYQSNGCGDPYCDCQQPPTHAYEPPLQNGFEPLYSQAPYHQTPPYDPNPYPPYQPPYEPYEPYMEPSQFQLKKFELSQVQTPIRINRSI